MFHNFSQLSIIKNFNFWSRSFLIIYFFACFFQTETLLAIFVYAFLRIVSRRWHVTEKICQTNQKRSYSPSRCRKRNNGPFISLTEPRRPFKKNETKCELIKSNDTFFVSKVFLLNEIHEIDKPEMKTILNFWQFFNLHPVIWSTCCLKIDSLWRIVHEI
jgi:hypothetical protein